MIKKIRALILVVLCIIAVRYVLNSDISISTDFNKENVPLPETAYEKVDDSCCFDSVANVKEAFSDFIDSLQYWFSFYTKVGD